MKRRIVLAAAAAAAALFALHVTRGMKAAEAIRKLSGLRLALALYSTEHRPPPTDINDLVKSGKMEGIPYLKLAGHLGHASIRQTQAMDIKDTGGWAYVNDPKAPDFGLVYIDCSHKDEKGRSWSEF
jgi:type II secretory pathway pseudopilin PulG